MKANFKRFFVLFLALLMVLPMALSAVVHAAEGTSSTHTTATNGMSFAANKTLTLPSEINSAPITFEAVIKVPKSKYKSYVSLLKAKGVSKTTKFKKS